MEDTKKQYVLLSSEIIAKMAIVFGPDIVILRARNVVGLVLNNNGIAVDILQDKNETLQKLIDSYLELSNQIVKSVVEPIFEKYPQVKK